MNIWKDLLANFKNTSFLLKNQAEFKSGKVTHDWVFYQIDIWISGEWKWKDIFMCLRSKKGFRKQRGLGRSANGNQKCI